MDSIRHSPTEEEMLHVYEEIVREAKERGVEPNGLYWLSNEPPKFAEMVKDNLPGIMFDRPKASDWLSSEAIEKLGMVGIYMKPNAVEEFIL